MVYDIVSIICRLEVEVRPLMMIQNYLLARTFENRGYTQEFLDNLDDPSYGQLGNLELFLQTLRGVYDRRDLIILLPDFDMDGIMSGCCGFAALAELGFRVGLFALTPADGYGFTADTIDRVRQAYPDARAILTSDVGISCHDGVAAAKAAGMTVLVTDHHKPPDVLPAADVIVDPMLNGDTYEHGAICGAFVLYQCMQAYANRYCDRRVQEQIRRLRVFAGIGTISDSMPLVYENRQIVRDAGAISRLVFSGGSDYIVKNIPGTPVYQSAFRGLYELYLRLSTVGRIHDSEDIDEQLFGYYLAPMFNSVKRMDGDLRRAFGVFFGQTQADDVSYLYDLNDRRKQTVSDALADMAKLDQPFAPYIYFSTASLGILGLLAQRLLIDNDKPCIVVAQQPDGSFKGSGRSFDWYPFLSRTKGLKYYAGGHETAFGVKFRNLFEVQELRDFLKTDLRAVLSSLPAGTLSVKPDFVIDHNGTGDTVIDILAFVEYMEELKRFKPFGHGFPEPNIALRFRPEEAEWKQMGSVRQHLKLELPRGLEVLLWNQGPKIKLQGNTGQDLVVMGHLGRSEFRGIETVNFTGVLQDIE